MKITFYKYQGAGNDFIIINNLASDIILSKDQVNYLCDRKFGIGADGLMLLSASNDGPDFTMNYWNSDGNPSSMCGNGGRCIVKFAHFVGLIENSTTFLAPDGIHNATIENEIVHLEIKNVSEVNDINHFDYELNTGSPHFVRVITEKYSKDDFYKIGKEVRNLKKYQPNGINVNFLSEIGVNKIHCTTYERGVENLTLSCGTGVTASAIIYHKHFLHSKIGQHSIEIVTDGGILNVSFNFNDNRYLSLVLSGPGQEVFSGCIEI